MEDVIIVGGGASGLMCALTYALKGNSVTILESGYKVGKKILASGNGRCNLTNRYFDLSKYNVYPAQLKKFDNTDTLDFFGKLGLVTYFDEEGRCYPVSNNSNSVLDVILNRLAELKCNIVTDAEVADIRYDKKFTVITKDKEYVAKKVVVATGGKSIINIIDKLGIPYTPFSPSLCGLITSEDTRSISGVRSKAEVKVLDTDIKESGEIIFKDNGISGICIFDISARLNWLDKKDVTISVNLCPNTSYQQLMFDLTQRKNNLGTFKVSQFLDGMFVSKLGEYIISVTHINKYMNVSKLSDAELSSIAKTIQELEFHVIDFDTNNQVHHGGINLEHLTETLESGDIPGLYFCGEIVNVDGICGGYNLQWAWTSGHIVGDSL